MKKVAAIIAAAVIIYSIYYDLSIGTLSIHNATVATSQVSSMDDREEKPDSIPFEVKKTENGDTVISVTEAIHNGPLPVSIEQLIDDFKKLNKGVQPNEIQLHHEYKFPVYNSPSE